MEAPVEIRYAGVVIGRAQEIRSAEGDDSFFLPGKEPMPVGTVLHLRSHQHETPARVIRAVESADLSICGMQVRLIGEAEEVAPDWIPEPAPAKPKASAPAPAPASPTAMAGTPTPTVEVDMARMQAETAKTTPAPAAESAGIPEAVPVAVGSSLTGALEKAAEAETAAASVATTSDDLDIVITDTPPPVAVDSLLAVTEPLPPPAESAPAVPAVEPSPAANDVNEAKGPAGASDSADEKGGERATPEASSSGEEMPPARPIAGSSSRRKTKRRKSQG